METDIKSYLIRQSEDIRIAAHQGNLAQVMALANALQTYAGALVEFKAARSPSYWQGPLELPVKPRPVPMVKARYG